VQSQQKPGAKETFLYLLIKKFGGVVDVATNGLMIIRNPERSSNGRKLRCFFFCSFSFFLFKYFIFAAVPTISSQLFHHSLSLYPSAKFPRVLSSLPFFKHCLKVAVKRQLSKAKFNSNRFVLTTLINGRDKLLSHCLHLREFVDLIIPLPFCDS
jgi:hypothetical protein